MMQKIVIEVQMRSRRRRAKAMKIAAVADGVNPVAFNEEKKDQMVIIGDGIDAASVVLSLRKKVGHATLVTVEEIVLEDI
ncbi:heavy metal-associated isoprenylated plant protein 47-like [Malus sylvestris]|uniref:heavy metal-associated isoprenylated plant protein 47-like n=1 Tax=Malus sylvestris TaxID=3752 RepID=UPI0021AC2440|nr:heavy metal-associated isoprenylated plant protein 47-like [Malus sylvestris]